MKVANGKRCPQIVDFEDLSAKDNIVLVVGPTGSGKSSFIEMATGATGLVGNSLRSCTRDITIVKSYHPELHQSHIYFIDTPGFDDTDISEVEILKGLSKWIIKAYKKRVRFRGVLYFHRISDNRMGGTPLQNLRNFEQLCGNDFYRIVLTTTMWDIVSEEKGGLREEALKNAFWQSMMERGSIIKRFRRDRESVIDVLSPLFNTAVTAKEIQPGDLSEYDNVIALMGPTGSGKSSFLEIATGVDGLVSHGLQSSSNKISIIKLSCPEFLNSDVCFVDTPGFDNSNKSDLDIFKMISDWLKDTYKRKIQLTGMLYFHRISDNRIGGTPLQNLRFFEGLCGKSFNNIVLTTTMWDLVTEEEGSVREKELKDVFWKSMIARGSTSKRFRLTRATAFEVLEPIFEEIEKKGVLLLQKEMIDLGLRLNQTTAGRTLFVELEKTILHHRSVLEKLRTNSSKFGDYEREQLEQEKEMVSKKLERALEDKQQLEIPILQKILLTIWPKPAFIWKSKKTKKEDGLTTQTADHHSQIMTKVTQDKNLAASPTEQQKKSAGHALADMKIAYENSAQDESPRAHPTIQDKKSDEYTLKVMEIVDEHRVSQDGNQSSALNQDKESDESIFQPTVHNENHTTPDNEGASSLMVNTATQTQGGTLSPTGRDSFNEYTLKCMGIADAQTPESVVSGRL